MRQLIKTSELSVSTTRRQLKETLILSGWLSFTDCGFCSKNFKTQDALRLHTKIHTEPAKLSCSHPGCDEVYQDRRSLKEHESAHMDPEVEYVCDEDNCMRVYTSPKALRNHKKMKHNNDDNDEISCDICKISFRKIELAEHLRIHI